MLEQRKKILIVDDEAGVRDSLRLLLKSTYEVLIAEDGEQALQQVEQGCPDLVLLDLILPKIDGIEALRNIKEKNPNIPIVILTGTNTVRTAVQAMKYGAVDYIGKPFDIDELKTIISAAVSKPAELKITSDQIQAEVTTSLDIKIILPEVVRDFGPMVGKSSAMNELFQKIRQISDRDTTVLVTGESGTGKELVAKLIHSQSKRKNGPFVAINCSAIPESLIESELFGHEKGSFTHAVERRIGHFELANGGTLFLDEIGELSLQVQVKILRFLQEQEFYRVGSSKSTKVDVRVISATNKNLEEAIKAKVFREDLYYRINVIGLRLPALRDRFEDVPALIQNFSEKFRDQYGGRTLKFSEEALNKMIEYGWPGNVRELENVVESLIALCPSDTVNEGDLPEKVINKFGMFSLSQDANSGKIGFEEAEKKFEMEIILKALKRTNYVQTRAAELLGISRRILKYKMDKLGISDQPQEVLS
ncbi:MAG: sigma-54 dependent transcriptional regulator [bacterium]|nr:sigma-54 dependent transcriptional regulator [bacterium]